MKLRAVLLAAAALALFSGAARAQSQPATVFVNPATVGVTQITASATGTTLATTATLAASLTQRTWICGLEIIANATGAATGNATVTGTISGTLNFTQICAVGKWCWDCISKCPRLTRIITWSCPGFVDTGTFVLEVSTMAKTRQ